MGVTTLQAKLEQDQQFSLRTQELQKSLEEATARLSSLKRKWLLTLPRRRGSLVKKVGLIEKEEELRRLEEVIVETR